jgi:hypothetical protein
MFSDKMCPTFVSINCISKHNTLYYLITEHSDGGILLEIPGELLVKIFFPKIKKSRLLLQLVLEKIILICGGGRITS